MSIDFLSGYKVILGSGSPRRRELLSALRIPFEVRVVETAETWPPQLPVYDVPEFLAIEKARVQMQIIQKDELLITADTVVVLNNRILNKPSDLQEAFTMLQNLSGQTHTVITGVCLSCIKGYHAFSVQTQVTFNPLDASEIHYYLQHFAPLDKAGAYGIQEWIGCVAMQRINGSYNNVVGLPTDALYKQLKTLSSICWSNF